jgi:hypothetical protein
MALGFPQHVFVNARTESLVPAPQLRAAPNFKRALAKFLARGIEFKADECAKHHDNSGKDDQKDWRAENHRPPHYALLWLTHGAPKACHVSST